VGDVEKLIVEVVYLAVGQAKFRATTSTQGGRMKSNFGWAILFAILAGAFVACGSGGDGGDGGTGYKYFAYVANAVSDDISAFSINTGTGALAEIAGSPFPTGPFSGAFPQSIAVDLSGKFCFVGNRNHGNVSAFVIQAGTGRLTAIAGSPFSTGGATTVTIDAAGKFAYVVTDQVAVFAIDAATGALTEIAGSPFPAGPSVSPAVWLALAASGKFAYVVNASGCVVGFAVDTNSGGLTEIAGSPFATGRLPTSITVAPSSRFAYVTYLDWSGTVDYGYVSAYSIDAVTGALVEIAGSPYATKLSPRFVAVDPAGKFAYVANSGAGNISAYSIDAATGVLAEIAGSPFPAGSGPTSIAFDPTGKFVYVTDTDYGRIFAYGFNSTTGALAEIAGSPFAAGSYSLSIATIRIKQ
jgi:6-phosphogluconolactonase (cycloisomerase 2 family)